MTKIVISGCCGRMGGRIAGLAKQDHALHVVGALEAAGHPNIGCDLGEVLALGRWHLPIVDDPEEAFQKGEVVIDFTSPLSTIRHVEVASGMNVGIVIGTTGLSPKDIESLQKAAKKIPILVSPNMSVGVNLLFNLVQEAARRLDKDYQIEVVEAHHQHKKDAPSGTAKKLAEIIAEARGVSAEAVPTHSIRAGDIVGDHTVLFCGPGERLELTHRAHSRDTFASGALMAAKFLKGRRPGLYRMSDVIGGAAK